MAAPLYGFFLLIIPSELRECQRTSLSCPGRSAARSPCGAVRCRAGAQLAKTLSGVPVLRCSASQELRAASRPGHESLLPLPAHEVEVAAFVGLQDGLVE